MPNIAVVWDFDGTLTREESTSLVAKVIGGGTSEEFWNIVHKLKGEAPHTQEEDKARAWQHVLAMDAPVWMYALSRLAFAKRIPLNTETFKQIAPRVELYPGVASFLRGIKRLEKTALLRRSSVKIHHFIVSAGLKELVEKTLPKSLITWTFGCRYQINAFEGDLSRPESIPVFCMDETMKTRSLFEISKGSFRSMNNSVNRRVPQEKRWAPFENMIYVGDGYTDVPAFSLVRSLGGLGIAVYDPDRPKDGINKKLERLRLDKRTDLITPAVFNPSSELFEFIATRCRHIAFRYRAERPL